jgi:hypothetical protein
MAFVDGCAQRRGAGAAGFYVNGGFEGEAPGGVGGGAHVNAATGGCGWRCGVHGDYRRERCARAKSDGESAAFTADDAVNSGHPSAQPTLPTFTADDAVNAGQPRRTAK